MRTQTQSLALEVRRDPPAGEIAVPHAPSFSTSAGASTSAFLAPVDSLVTRYDDWPAQPVGGLVKRAFDVAGAGILLVLVSPLLLVIALVVMLQDGGSPFYRHARVGLGGRSFHCIKFRSMMKDGEQRLAELLASNPAARAEWAASQKLENDPRVTSFGAFLRRSSLDELPQLINVLRGEMSLVGPRPVVANELPRYDLARVHYLRTRPGMTGLWQVSGRSLTTYEARVSLDKAYALRWSLPSDVWILVRTLPAVLLRRGAT